MALRKKRILLGIIISASLGCIGLAAMLGYFQNMAVRDVISDQFNQEQLVIAENAAHYIESEINFLKKELVLLKKAIQSGRFDPDAHLAMIQQLFLRVLGIGVSKIEIDDTYTLEKYIFTAYSDWGKATWQPNADWVFQNVKAASGPEEQGKEQVYIIPPIFKSGGILLKMACITTGDYPKILTLHMDITWFLTPFLKEIRSGKSGYAWLIDEQGMFLFHPLSEFIGKNAFSVRQKKQTDMSFYQINFIQKEQMLKGQKGTGWYFSYWHRGITGKIKKLIAYCPVLISDKIQDQPARIWSIAVVAPISEIESTLNDLFFRQAVLLGFIVVIISIGTGLILFFDANWSSWLELQVEKRTEQLQRSEEKYRSLVESAEDFIFAIDAHGNLLSLNSYTATFFGGAPDEFVGKSLAALFDGQFEDEHQKKIELVLEKGKSIKDEFEIKFGDHKFWISANYMPLKNESNRVDAVLCIARDITESKNLEKQLVNAEKLASIGTLAAGVAHEINNPLGIILGFSDILIRQADKSTQVYDDLKTIERQGYHCKEVVENLLSFARIGQSISQYSQINSCIMDVIKVVRHTLEMNDIELIIELNQNLPMVRGDGRQMQQVFLNLINNALAAIKSGGILKITSDLENTRNKVVIVFEDSGTGIREEDLEHIFEPFFTTKPEGEGTGLGLFVSYGIITKYGGTIECESTTQMIPDKPRGTRFIIRLPIYKGGDDAQENIDRR